MIEQEYSYVLKQVSPTLQARGGFQYPSSGMVECPDWNPRAECGNGLHGWLRGEGDAGLASHGDSGKWLILSVPTKSIVDLVGKVKFPRAEVLKVGTRDECTSEMVRLCPGAAVIWGTATAGYRGTATAGDYGTATAGYGGTATAGYMGTATAGDRGTATAGYGGTATAGYGGTATAGDRGTATAGDRGTATAGDRGTATAGYGGTATAAEGGELRLRWWDGNRYRTSIGYVGEGGIEAGIAYKADARGHLVRA